MSTNTIRWSRGGDGIVVLTLDDPNQSANTMNADYGSSMAATVERLEAEQDEIRGVVITSAKKTFFAGGDLRDLRRTTRDDVAAVTAWVRDGKALLRRVETLGKPVAAAINGAALGGGLEIALACHFRVCVNDPKVQLGFPEVTLGLLPGAGGVVRSVRMLGVRRALTDLLLQGQRIPPTIAHELGLVDELVTTREELVPAARAWIDVHGEGFSGQRWEQPGYRIPGGTPAEAELAIGLATLPANLSKQLKGANYPAPHGILAAAVEGAQVDVDTAFEIESRYFVDLVTGQVSKNMIQAFFFDLQAVSSDRGRPPEIEPWQASKVVVLGAGMMGAAIAYVCAQSGMEVVLKDIDQAAAERGRRYSEKLVAKAVERARMTQEHGDELLSRITATIDPAAAQGADLVIEAVFENESVKAQVYAEVEPYLAEGALFGSNTSTLPITRLADHVSDPGRFIGLHFFSPVDKMPLLEIIRGEQTSDEAVYHALDVAKQIRKTPILVNDSRGFFTSRVISTFVNEAIGMLAEGIPAASIEQASSQAGYPAPVLALTDEINMKLVNQIALVAEEAGQPDMSNFLSSGARLVIGRMLSEFDRPGRLEGSGFYAYEDGRRVGLWTGLADAFPVVADPSAISLRDLRERMLFIEAIETVKCVDEGVIESVADANIGSIMGIGFPGWTGGVLQCINGYDGGLAGFVARARELAARYGERFSPPASLVERAERGGVYVNAPELVAAGGD